MKECFLALAMLCAFPGAAGAQPKVTAYGRVDAGVGVADPGGPGGRGATFVWSGVQSASRLGLRGSEELGNGLRATFNLEAGVESDTGDSLR